MAKIDDIPISKTDKGVRIDLGSIYYYPAKDGHGNIAAPGNVNKPFEDEIELLYDLSNILRRAKQLALKP